MILGMSLQTFTLVHVIITLIAIASGLVVLLGMLGSHRMPALTALFLFTTVLTSVTGFMFPYHGPTPAVILGLISLPLLAVAVYARYVRKMAGGMRKAYVITAMLAFYLNVFVLVAQLFQKVPALHALAPKGSEPPFMVAQVVVLVLFILFTNRAVKGFRGEALRPA